MIPTPPKYLAEIRKSIQELDANLQLTCDLPILGGTLADAGFVGVKVGWKDEGDYGPVWIEDAQGNSASGNDWITRAKARKMAKALGLPFEEF